MSSDTSSGNAAPSAELLAVRRRAMALADGILAYSRAFDRYREALQCAVAAGATQEQTQYQVEIAAASKPERAAALRQFVNTLPES